MNAQHRRWLITGAATGFGRALAEAVVAAGDAVVAAERVHEVVHDLRALDRRGDGAGICRVGRRPRDPTLVRSEPSGYGNDVVVARETLDEWTPDRARRAEHDHLHRPAPATRRAK